MKLEEIMHLKGKTIDKVTCLRDEYGAKSVEFLFTDGSHLRIEDWERDRLFIYGGTTEVEEVANDVWTIP